MTSQIWFVMLIHVTYTHCVYTDCSPAALCGLPVVTAQPTIDRPSLT